MGAKAMKAMKAAAAPKVMKKKAAMKVMKKKAAMKAMKVMKKKAAMKAMKAMKKKTVSKIARGRMAYAMVLRGSKAKTVGGLTAKDLTKNKNGKIVSKKASALGKKHPWMQAVAKARKALKITGFTALKKGTPFYAREGVLQRLSTTGEEVRARGGTSSRCGDSHTCGAPEPR